LSLLYSILPANLRTKKQKAAKMTALLNKIYLYRLYFKLFLGLRALFRTQIYIFLVFELVGFYYTHIAGIGYTTKQEAVDKSLNLGHLTIRQLTVAMSVNNTPTHSVGYTEALPNLTGCLCRRQHSLISQPFIVRVAQ
jgi:hypothetical protein